MAGVKRKAHGDSGRQLAPGSTKKFKPANASGKGAVQSLFKPERRSKKDEDEDDDGLVESDTSEEENGFYGFSAKKDEEGDAPDDGLEDRKIHKPVASRQDKPPAQKSQAVQVDAQGKGMYLERLIEGVC